ncbi:unnamed protein product, partial [Rotaria sordida]
IDIDDYSDDENNVTDSENVNLYSINRSRRNTRTTDNNPQLKENVRNGETNTVEFLPTPDSPLDEQNSMNSKA